MKQGKQLVLGTCVALLLLLLLAFSMSVQGAPLRQATATPSWRNWACDAGGANQFTAGWFKCYNPQPRVDVAASACPYGDNQYVGCSPESWCSIGASIIVPANKQWVLDKIEVMAADYGSVAPEDALTLKIFEAGAEHGPPGTLIAEDDFVGLPDRVFSGNGYIFDPPGVITYTVPLTLTAGTYWVMFDSTWSDWVQGTTFGGSCAAASSWTWPDWLTGPAVYCNYNECETFGAGLTHMPIALYGEETDLPTPTPTIAATATPTATPTATHTPTATLTPTATRTPTVTPIPAAEVCTCGETYRASDLGDPGGTWGCTASGGPGSGERRGVAPAEAPAGRSPTAWAGSAAVLAAMGLGAGGVWAWKRRKRA